MSAPRDTGHPHPTRWTLRAPASQSPARRGKGEGRAARDDSSTGLGWLSASRSCSAVLKAMTLFLLGLFGVVLWALAWSTPGGFVQLLGVGVIAIAMAAAILRAVMKGSR